MVSVHYRSNTATYALPDRAGDREGGARTRCGKNFGLSIFFSGEKQVSTLKMFVFVFHADSVHRLPYDACNN